MANMAIIHGVEGPIPGVLNSQFVFEHQASQC